MKNLLSRVAFTVVLSASHVAAQKVDMEYVASLFGSKDITPALLSTGTLREGNEKLIPDKKPGSKNLQECDFSVNECDTDAECAPGLLCTDPRKKEFAAKGFGDLFQRRVYCIPKVATYKDQWNWEICYDPKKLETYITPQPAPVAAPVKLPVAVPVALPLAAPVSAPVSAPVAAPAAAPVATPVASPAAAPVSTPAAVVGDPHFVTYDGAKYSYHGECDLVLATNPTFDAGLGLAIHVRSEIVTTWSLISNAAVQIGKDVFEVVNDETHYFNRVANAAFPLYMAGKYEITKAEINSRPTYTINMNNGETIDIFINKRMIGVRSSKSLGSTGGMTGVVGVDGLVGRDGMTTFTDVNSMGAEWQVRDNEAMLFHSLRAPQYPQQCKLPTIAVVDRRRLRSSDTLMNMAKDACAKVDETLKEFCMEDVMLTKDQSAANSYLDGVAY